MNDHWQAAWKLFQESVDLRREEVDVFLERASLSPEVRDVVLRMLVMNESARTGVSLGSWQPDSDPGKAIADALSAPSTAGTVIDRYLLIEKIGEGGMGEVWMVEQKAPVRRRLALKLIKGGASSREVIARFESERQALALMDHPGIAKVFDAGATPLGIPYFVMEYAEGEPITQYCDRYRLATRERLELFIEVCDGVGHAHRKAIIHRDLKPSNILVTVTNGRPAPKIIDFGVAKALTQKLSTDTIHTRFGALIGTPEYMSPEQAASSGLDIDTRTDVYALGIVLYELLAGERPIVLHGMGLEEFLRRLREQDTRKPSTRVNTKNAATAAEVALRRSTEPAALARQLRGDLDAIVLKALEKDRSRRYGSVSELAEDIGRYLRNEAVRAVGSRAGYRARKFAVRHKWALVVAAAFVGVLITAVIWMSIALHQQQRANVSAAALREVVRKIIIERPVELARMPNRTALRSELMRDAEGALVVLSRDLRGDDGLQEELAKAYLAIGMAKGPYGDKGSEGDPAAAALYVSKSVELYSTLARAKPDDPNVRRGQLEAFSTLLHLQYRLGRREEGKRIARDIENQIASMPPALADKVQARWYQSIAYMELASILWNEGATGDALDVHRKAVVTFRDAFPPAFQQDPDKVDDWSHLQRELAISAWMFEGIGPEALTEGRRAVQVLAGCTVASCCMRHAQALGTLGEMDWAAGNRDRGIAELRESVVEFESLLTDDPGNSVLVNAGAQVRSYLALILAHEGNGNEAIKLAEENLGLPAGKDAMLVKGRERRFVYEITLGASLVGARRFADAERALRMAWIRSRDWNANLDLQWSAMHLLIAALVGQGKYDEAVTAARDARKVAEQASPGKAFYARVLRSIAARDFASAVALWRRSSSEQCVGARRSLDEALAGIDRRHGVLLGALLEYPPKAEEQAALEKALYDREQERISSPSN